MASEANFKLARHWLKECLSSHSTCAISDKNTPLPTRVLDIGTSVQLRLNLLHTANEKVDSYACLSYCWGKDFFIILTLAQLCVMSKNIKFEALPTTFMDAVIVARRLDTQYLWIDALCIIQDSKEDMKTELVKMADIYKNACLTVIAASAANANEGSLQSLPIPDRLIRAPLETNDKDAGAVLLRPIGNLEGFDQHSDYTDTRVWCLQESILSPRCSVFSSLHLYWCCYQPPYARHDERYTRSSFFHPTPLTRPSHIQERLPRVFHSGRRCNSLTADDHKELHDFWRSIVGQYSRRQITDVSDRFRALSAIAHEFHSITGDTYVAGLWLSNLPHSLLWRSDPYGNGDLRRWKMPDFEDERSEYVNHVVAASEYETTPSWIWLSLPDKVSFTHKMSFMDSSLGMAPDFKITDVDFEFEDPDEPLGSVKHGVLTVRGRMASALLWVDNECPQLRKHTPNMKREPNENIWAISALDSWKNERDGKEWDEYTVGNETRLLALEVKASLPGSVV